MSDVESQYEAVIQSKRMRVLPVGVDVNPSDLPDFLYPFQAPIVRWAAKRGRAAIWADCGMGKTPMQLAWAHLMMRDSGDERCLILAPLAVARQTVEEAKKFGYDVPYVRTPQEMDEQPVTITNYERLDAFDNVPLRAVVCDESSILKSFDGSTRGKLIERFSSVPYRLACTATPAPNDYLELGNHAQFLGIMSWQEMAAMFFVHDQQAGDGNRGAMSGAWRLKGHAEEDFWRWLVTWGVFIRRPSDIGFEDDRFKLPKLSIEECVVKTEAKQEGQLFATRLHGVSDRAKIRKQTKDERVSAAVECIIKSCKHTILETTTSSIAQSASRSQRTTTKGTETSDSPICGRGTSGTKTKQESISAHTGRHTLRNAGRREETTTEETKNASKLRSGSGNSQTHRSGTPNDSENTISRLQPMNGCSQDSEDVARSADASSKQMGRGSSTQDISTTATKRMPSGGFSADRAISDSASSRTTSRRLDEQWIIWCGLNDEQDDVCRRLENSGVSLVSVQGGDDIEERTDDIMRFIHGEVDVIVSKPRVLGLGMNLQNANNQVFVGLGDSYEQYYQCIRRSWRYGQKKPVKVVIVTSEIEERIVANVKEKEREAERMAEEMVKRMADLETQELKGSVREEVPYRRDKVEGDGWTMHLGDCVDVMREMPAQSIDFSVYSPPFASLYTYSNSPRDMGNSRGIDEFFAQFDFAVRELLRITKTGRLTACHVSQLAAMQSRDGYIGLKDFRGRVIDAFNRGGWIHHGEVVIDKNPQAQAIRTKTKGLMFVQLRKDSSWMRPALADFLLLFRALGENAVPVHPEITNEDWIKWAHPVWYDIRETETLTAAEGRDEKDEKHICPLQLDVIDRALMLWTNKGETVFSPFAGIGSEGYQSILRDRRFIGAELKESYWRAACQNLKNAVVKAHEGDLFASTATASPEPIIGATADTAKRAKAGSSSD